MFTWTQSLKQWLFGNKFGKTIRNRRNSRRRSFRPLAEQLELRLALATNVVYTPGDQTLTFTRDAAAAETITLVDDLPGNQVQFSATDDLSYLVASNGEIETFGALTPGSGYTTVLQYNNVPLTGGTGAGATANITVTNGSVNAVSLVAQGAGYTLSDVLSAAFADLGGVAPGTAFTVTVGGVTAGAIDSIGAPTANSGYLNQITYNTVPLTGGAGSGATADITVTNGSVSAVVLVDAGTGYAPGNSLSAASSNLGGGAPTAFSILVATVEANPFFTEVSPGIYQTTDPLGVDKIVIDLSSGAGDGDATLVIETDWNYEIPVDFFGGDDLDSLNLVNANEQATAPQSVFVDAIGASGFNGDNQNIVFTNLDAVDFGSNAGDQLAVSLISVGNRDFNYDVTSPGMGMLTDVTSLLTLSFTGLDNTGAPPVTLSVTDGALTPATRLGTLMASVSSLNDDGTTISGGDSNSTGRMYLAFEDLQGPDLDFSIPLVNLTFMGDGAANDTIDIGTLQGNAAALALVSPGAGYAVNDELKVLGGQGNTPAYIKVTGVSSGAITSWQLLNAGSYGVFPTGTLATEADAGTGSGASFTLGSLFASMTTPALTVDGTDQPAANVINVNSNLLLGNGANNGDLNLTADTINLKSASLDTSGGTDAGSATFTGAVVLGANVAINTDDPTGTDGSVSFVTSASTINADNAATQNRTLTITSGDGSATFDGNIGTSAALADFDVTAAAINFNNAPAQTVRVNDQGGNTATLTGAVTLMANVTIDTDGAVDNHVLFSTSDTTIDADAPGRELVVTSGTASVTFQGDVGGGTALADLDVTAGTINLFAPTYNVNNSAGAETITFTGAVVLQDNLVTITTDRAAGTDNSVRFDTTASTINADDSTANDRALVILAGSVGNAVIFDAAIGGSQALAYLEVTAATINFNHATVRVDDQGGNTSVFTGASVLAANLVVDGENGGSDNSIEFAGTINADDDGTPNRTLTVNAGTQTATFGGSIGNTEALADLDVTADIIALNGTTINVDDDNSPAATVTFQGEVQLGANVAIDTDKSTNDSNIHFPDLVDSNSGETLTLTAGTGNISFDSDVGVNGALGALTINSAFNVAFAAGVESSGAITQLAGTGLTTFAGAAIAGTDISITTKNITVLASGPGSLDATDDVILDALNNIDLQPGTSLTAGDVADLDFGAANGDSVTLSGSFIADTATITGTNAISNTLTINYQTATLTITSGLLAFDTAGGAGTNRLVANGSSVVDTFTLSGTVLTKNGNSDVSYTANPVQIIQLNAGDGADVITISGGGSTSTTVNGDGGNDVITLTAGTNVTLNGGADDDDITLSGGSTKTNITVSGDAGAGTSGNDDIIVSGASTASLYGNDGHDTFTISAALTGIVVGGNGDDLINLTGAAGAVSSSVDGNLGTDTLSYAGYVGSPNITISGAGTVDGFKGSGSGLPVSTSAFNNINTFVGNGTATTVKGLNTASTWLLTGPNAGTYTSTSPARTFSFSGATLLQGGTAVDTFKSNGFGVFAGTINGGSGSDVIDYSLNSVGSVYTLTALNTGNIDGNAFIGVESLRAGTNADTFIIPTGGSIAGKISGGDGTDLLSYAGRTSAVQVDLAKGTATATGGIILVSGAATIENVIGSSTHDVIFGSSLANDLNGGAGGNDILVGQGGDDVLTKSSAGRSIMIGGDGTDTITTGAAAGDALIIGGSTSYDSNKTALNALLKEWTRLIAYDLRVKHLRGTLGGGLNSSYKLTTTTVAHNILNDVVDGSANAAALNWYIVAATANVTNTGKTLTETITVI